MYKLVLDLEMGGSTLVDKTLVHPYIKEVIEIGAVLLDDDNNKVKKFRTYVKPRHSIVTKSIQRLTGITNEMLVDAPYFEDAIHEILKEIPDDTQLCTWSDADTFAIQREMEIKEIKQEDIGKLQKLCEGYFDIQRELSDKLSFNRVLNLEKALNLVGIDFKGKAHGALDDAINTAELYKAMYNDEAVKKAIEQISESMSAKPLTSSLGSMIDFSQFGII